MKSYRDLTLALLAIFVLVANGSKSLAAIVWGYKAHILADTKYELPIALNVSAGNVHDSQRASNVLSEARVINSRFNPEYVICDSAYSSDKFRRLIKRQYRAEPMIDPHPVHKKAVANTVKTPEWKKIYDRRVSIERLNGRLKGFRRLNHINVRGRFKVRVHAMMSIIVCQAQAVATGSKISIRKVA